MEMWIMFSSTIENLFDEPANLELFPPNAYIHLLYAVRMYIPSQYALYCCDIRMPELLLQ